MVNLRVTVTVSKAGTGDAPTASDMILKGDKIAPLNTNTVTTQVWKEVDSEKPIVAGSVLQEALLSVISRGTSSLPVRVGQGICLWFGKSKTDGQGVESGGHGVKTDNFKVLWTDNMPPEGDCAIPTGAVHVVEG